MEKQRITIEITTDADPSQLLDAALEFGKGIVEEHGGKFDDDNGAWVEYLDQGGFPRSPQD
jgi:hypothetical protein